MSTKILVKETCQECAGTGHIAWAPEYDARPCSLCDGKGYRLCFVRLDSLIRDAVRDIVEARR